MADKVRIRNGFTLSAIPFSKIDNVKIYRVSLKDSEKVMSIGHDCPPF
jgi:hypothetical protein